MNNAPYNEQLDAQPYPDFLSDEEECFIEVSTNDTPYNEQLDAQPYPDFLPDGECFIEVSTNDTPYNEQLDAQPYPDFLSDEEECFIEITTEAEDPEVIDCPEVLEPLEKPPDIYKVGDDNPIKGAKGKGGKKDKKKPKNKKGKKNKRIESYPQLPPIYYSPPPDPIMVSMRETLSKAAERKDGHDIPLKLCIKDRIESGFIFGYDPIQHALVGKHTNHEGNIGIFGGTGAGKTSCLAKPTMKFWKHPIFAIDFKGDLIQEAARDSARILYMVEGYKNNFYYDPFYFLREDGEYRLVQNARELAHAIIPPPAQDEQSFWIMAARDVLTAAIIYYFNLGVSFIDAMIEIKTTQLANLMELLKTDRTAAVCVNQDICLNPKTLSGVSLELHNHISVFATDLLIQDILSCPEDGERYPIDWEWLEWKSFFIRIDQSRLEQWSGVVRLMLVQMIRTLERRPEKYSPEAKGIEPTLILLDEFPQYGKIDIIPSAMKILRSKNVTFAIFCQSLADLDETYGEKTRRTILDNCPYQVILSVNDADTQRYFSERVGPVKTTTKGFSATYGSDGRRKGYNASVNESLEPAIFPHEFATHQDVVLLCPESNGFCRLEKFYFFGEGPQERYLQEKGDNENERFSQ